MVYNYLGMKLMYSALSIFRYYLVQWIEIEVEQ